MDEERESAFNFECLQLRINSDFSDQLIFSYAISNSAFPFGSSAIVHNSATVGGEASGNQFIQQYMHSHEKNCFTNYVESSRSDDPDIGGNQYNDVVNGGNGSDDSETRKASSRNTTCSHSGRFSCLRTITSLAPIARVRMASYSAFQEAASDFLFGLTEDHVLESLDLFIEGKASGRDSMNFLRP